MLDVRGLEYKQLHGRRSDQISLGKAGIVVCFHLQMLEQSPTFQTV